MNNEGDVLWLDSIWNGTARTGAPDRAECVQQSSLDASREFMTVSRCTRVAGGADGAGRGAGPVHCGGHQRRDPAPGGHEGRQDHRRHQLQRRRAHLPGTQRALPLQGLYPVMHVAQW